MKVSVSDDTGYERKAAAGGQFMLNLKASNRQVIGTSETYATEAPRDRGIESVKANAAGAATIDQS